MRYYDITITSQSTEGVSTLGLSTAGALSAAASTNVVGTNSYGFTTGATNTGQVVRRWTSHPNGKFDPGALNVEFDIPVATYGNPIGMPSILIEGVPLQDLLQAQQFTGMKFKMLGGMKAGLPLANPNQSGTIVQGQIFQSFGNWEGTEMTLDFVLNPGQYTSDNPGNIVLNWTAGQKLSDALTQTLSVAFPGVAVTINISDELVQSSDDPHRCGTLEELAQLLQDITKGHFFGPKYDGVHLSIQGGQISVWDDTYEASTIQLAFTDFVGQPTWIQPNIMQIKLVMRADIQLGGTVKMPAGLQNKPGATLTSAAAMPSSLKYKSTFEGSFSVTEVRHIGNFRAPDGASWATVVNCTPIPDSQGKVTLGPLQVVGVGNG
ncbi:hypothetical protein [Burkholderia plantarii]|uniref:hypothetical protein n=1 Tax=Burkholderia plantarii TaxID=41899 RepID=UPI00087075D6|nr:hypothetical protein [Burkholderia plantarii]